MELKVLVFGEEGREYFGVVIFGIRVYRDSGKVQDRIEIMHLKLPWPALKPYSPYQ